MLRRVWLPAAGLAILLFGIGEARAADVDNKLPPALEKGIGQYRHENYDEALAWLERAREEQPRSTLAAYYLGLNYKRLQNYRLAIPHLRDAVTWSPKIKGALIELIDCLYRYGELEEADKWITEARREGIRPAQVDFLAGLVRVKQERFDDAVDAFASAARRDPSLEAAARYQTGLAHLKAEDLSRARTVFQEVAAIQPSSAMARYAETYLRAIERTAEALRPWRVSLNTAWQYDDNVVLKPGDEAFADRIADQSDWRTVTGLRLEHRRRFNDRWDLRGHYNFYYAKQNDLGFYDTMSHTVTLQPGRRDDNALLAAPVSYTHTTVDDRSYLSSPSAGLLYNRMAGRDWMAQAQVRYAHRDYLWTPSSPAEDRDGHEGTAGLGIYRFFAGRRGFVHFSYAAGRDWTGGQNWEQWGQQWQGTVVAPLREDLRLTLSGSVERQDFLETHTVFGEGREDWIYTGSALLAWDVFDQAQLQIQYTFVRADSNLSVYDYERNIYSTGVEIHF